ncbi:MFS transporter [Amycolatopsis rhizosphaerae]|uniref:MFS transporter n=1 Tax=Amycolatopsis rhizosphaerae TaxID=2053003 RepID=A0A558DIP8_9PSEU|nr:MFS transporter [Amycolatopsis rhizosphaerae]TVT60863.1 MFS transporter [Amycolatopsis rhizosphaerae]
MSEKQQRLFAALRVPNFRLYFAGQAVSLTGTWMQSVAQSWLVLELSGSGTVLGLVIAAQFLPVLLAGPYGGLIADRSDKRRLLLFTQSALATLALLLGLLTVTHLVRLWMVVVFALALGTVNAVDNPTRQTFVPEVVGKDLLGNAVSLNSVLVNTARAVGPAVAGLLIAGVGVGMCFLANAVSYVAVLVALARMRVDRLHPARPVPSRPGQLVEGLRYVRGNAGLWVPLTMMALVGTLAYEFQVVLPLFARVAIHGDARTYGFLTAAMGAGAVAGGLAVAARGRAGVLPLVLGATGFGLALGVATVAPSLPTELAALALVGVGSTAFLATGNTTLQLITRPSFRGRVMALWSVTFLGSTPIGGPIVGVVAQFFGPRAGLGLGAAACLAAAVLGLCVLPRIPGPQRLIPRPVAPEVPPVTESDRS